MRTGRQIVEITALMMFSCGNAVSQTSDVPLTLNPECATAITKAIGQVIGGQLAEAGEALSTALSRLENRTSDLCAGLILHNLATIASTLGRFAEAERLAVSSIARLEKVNPADDHVLWRPLMLLAGARLDQGKKSAARADLKRLSRIQPEQPQDRALLRGTEGSLLQQIGEHANAEVEYLAALEGWEESGCGETADAAAVLTSLASLYVQDRRFEDARRSLDRASAIFSQSKIAAPIDRSKLLMVRGALHARQRQWTDAESDFREALARADALPAVDAGYILTLLTSFTEALDKNHHREEGLRMKVRVSALRLTNPSLEKVVDVSDLRARPK